MIEFKLPAIGEGVVEVEIVRWLKQPGQSVHLNEGLVEVMTDKATVEIPSPHAGTLQTIHANEGVTAAVGTTICTLDDHPSPVIVPPPVARPLPQAKVEPPGAGHERAPVGGRVLATPAARALARETGIDLATVEGRDGRITKGDVIEAQNKQTPSEAFTRSFTAPRGTDLGGTSPYVAEAPKPPRAETRLERGEPRLERGEPQLERAEPRLERGEPRLGRGEPRLERGEPRLERVEIRQEHAETRQERVEIRQNLAPPRAARDEGTASPSDRIPFRGVRRRTADTIDRAFRSAVHCTYVDEVDVTRLVEVRNQARKAAASEGIALNYLPFVIKAVLRGLKRFPILNARLDAEREEVILHRHYDIGVATATEHGLMVPVLRGVDRLSLLDTAVELERLVARARSGHASREELTGSTFTITSLGALGGLHATPILNYPEVGILGVHAIRKVPIVTSDDRIAVGHVMNLSVSFDHRVVDGFESASFLQEVKRYLEDPTLLLLAGI